MKIEVTYSEPPREAHIIHDTKHGIMTLRLPAGHSHTALFTILHEYAHIGQGHLSTPTVGFAIQALHELKASQLALRWIRPELREKAIRYYLSCIAPRGYTRRYYREVEHQLRADPK